MLCPSQMIKIEDEPQEKSIFSKIFKWLCIFVLVSILVAGSILGYNIFMGSYRTNQAVYNLKMAANKILVTYRDDFTDMTPENIAKLGLNFDNPFGKDIKVLKYDDVSFGLQITEVPKEACMFIAKSQWGNNFVVSSPEKMAEFTIMPLRCREKNTIIIDYERDIATSLDDPCAKCDGRAGCMMRNGCI